MTVAKYIYKICGSYQKKRNDVSTQGERTAIKHNHGLWKIGEIWWQTPKSI